MYHAPDSPAFQATMHAREYLVKAIQEKIAAVRKAGQSDVSTVRGLVYAIVVGDTKEDIHHHSGRTLTEDEIIDNALLLILAGTEVTSSTIANAVLLLGLHPDVFQKVRSEQEQMIQRHGGETLTKALLDNKCPYLDAVVRETMRVLPATLVSRRAVKDTIVVDGQQIPKGYGVSYNIYLTHQHDPMFFVPRRMRILGIWIF